MRTCHLLWQVSAQAEGQSRRYSAVHPDVENRFNGSW